jgi:ribosomal protein S27AE
MPTIVLRFTIPPEDGSSPLLPQTPGPLLRGNGDADYLCGNCGFTIASSMGPMQRVPFDSTTCPACGARNEFPADLRA